MVIVGFATVAALWAAFAAAVLLSPSSIDGIWRWFKTRPPIVRVALGILFLPWVAGMWIWEASWPIAARGVLVGGIAWANVYAFSPWRPFA